MPTARRTATVALLVLALLAAAVGPSVAFVAQQDYEVADGREGSVDPGREDDEEQQFPINMTFYPIDHSPGATGGSFEVFASGLTENGTLHWIVLETGGFDVGTCKSTDASAFGIDRGNDGKGTETDKSLLTAYKSYTSTSEGFFIEFYKEQGIAGEPVKGSVYDQIVARQNNCVNNPEEKGWYRVNGYINGSTKHDTQTDYTVYATSQYTYICDCESREEARQKLGPPPNEQGGSSDPTPTVTATATPTPTPAATATPTPTPAATATPTPTASQGPDTQPTDDQQQDQEPDGDQNPPTTATGTVTTTADGSRPAASPAGTATPMVTATTPTLAEGPGFGVALALFGLLTAGLVALSRKN